MAKYEQIPLHISLVESYLEEDFIVSAYNQDVFGLLNLDSWGVMPYSNFVLIYGRKSSGKTHFCHIFHRKIESIFVHEYEDIMRNTDKLCYIIDDADIINPEEMFHIFNIINEKQSKCIITTNAYPFKSGLPDLDSRMNSVFSINLDIPDYEMVRVFLTRQFNVRSISFNPEVIDYIAARMPYDLNKILSIVHEVNQFMLINKSRLTISTAKKILDHQILDS